MMALTRYLLVLLSCTYALAAPAYKDPNYIMMKSLDLLPPSNATIRRVFVLAASGTQNYICTQNTTTQQLTFTLKEPIANLSYVGGAEMGKHYFRADQAGGNPTWETGCGSSFVTTKKVKGVVSPAGAASAIDWLLTETTSSSARGMFARVKYVARINTVGGVKPNDTQCTQQGLVIPVHYTSDYVYFK